MKKQKKKWHKNNNKFYDKIYLRQKKIYITAVTRVTSVNSVTTGTSVTSVTTVTTGT